MRKQLHVLSTHLLDPRLYDLIPVKYGNTLSNRSADGKNKKSTKYVQYVPHWDYYVLHYAFRGKGTLWIDDVAYPVSAGECFLICPDDNAKYVADEEDPWYCAWLGFRGEAAKELTHLPSPVFPLPARIFEPLLSMENANGAEDYLLLSILYTIFASLFSHPQSVPSYAEATALYIRQHFHEPITVTSLAERLGITPRYLSTLFKQAYGKTLQSHLMEIRFTHARDLLLQGSSVSQAAFAVGYTDPFVFSRSFSRYFGAPPKHFIEKGKSKTPSV